jgi:signal transduction histidine kinase/ligand-binding sensor domain-containing protein/CheY-like chemotaxis protein
MYALLARALIASGLAAAPGAAMAGVPPAPPRFATLGVADGLPSSVVNQIAQDRDGFIWIGTRDGLARYDGIGFEVFRNRLGDPGSLSANDVTALLVDSQGRLWCGGGSSGLNRLDPDGRHFYHWHHVPNEVSTLGSDDVWALAEDRAGAIWVGTYLGGLNRLEADGHFLHLDHDADDPASLRSSTVLALAGDASGRLWVGTDVGLDVRGTDGRITHVDIPPLTERPGRSFVLAFEPEADGSMLVGTRKGLFRIDAKLAYAGEIAASEPPLAVVSLAHDAGGALWIGTYSGLARDADGTLEKFHSEEGFPGALPGTRVTSILDDTEGGLWFGLFDGGVARLAPHWRNFSGYRHRPGDAASLAFANIRALAVDSGGGVWAAAGSDGLDHIDARTGAIERWGPRLGGLTHLVWGILPDGPEHLWIGHSGGLRRISLADAKAVDLPVDTSRPDALPSGFVDHIVAVGDGTLWASAHGGGIAHVAMANPRVLHRYGPGDGSLDDTDVTALLLDARAVPWIATSNGIERYAADQDRFVKVSGIAPGPVYSMAFAANGDLWLHRQGEVMRCSVQGTQAIVAERIGAGQGWPTLSGGDLAVASDGSVWVASLQGLWRIDGKSRVVRHFGPDDGLLSPEFHGGTLAEGPDGALFAGTLAGVVGFDPAHLAFDLPPPPVRLVGLAVHRGRDTLALDPARAVHLRYDDRDLSVEVRGLSYANPAANHYRFRLAGFDPDWVDEPGGERVFSQLAPGRYSLEVQAANVAGVWGKLPHALTVVVAAPPWATPWAYAAYALGLLLLLAALLGAWRSRLRRRHALLLAEERRRNAEQLADSKSNFLATMGHEIRTPLTAVLGMTELLLGTRLDERQRDYAGAIRQSGELLLRQVNDSLDLARIEAGKLALESVPFDPRAVLAGIVALERPLAQRKGLALEIDVASGVPRLLLGDALRLKQVLLNLLGNAIKFTEHGRIDLQLGCGDPDGIVLRVADSGPGMTADVRTRLFRRFEQADGGVARRHGGSGLGLAICRELVELMGGSIEVDSEPERGSVFVVRLPLEAAPLVGNVTAPSPSAPIAPVAASAPPAPAPAPAAGLDVLLVEDDPAVARAMSGLLEHIGHRPRHAANGLAALGALKRGRFGLALLDLDLPGVDGLALARMIRRGETGTAHLALIAVTARASGDEETLCRAAGIDGFLRKPLTSAALAEEIARLRIVP